jgi:glycosyltransferase involved in cell wall biosynthesis
MKVLFIPFIDIRGQSARYRAFWPAAALRDAGVEARCIPWQRCRCADVEWADVTIFERLANALARPWWRDPPWWSSRLRRGRLRQLWEVAQVRGPVGYDLDDLAFLPGHERGRSDVTAWQVEHLRRADFLLTPTAALQGRLREFNPRVIVVPNCLDIEAFPEPASPRGHSPLRLGWMCGVTHAEDEPLFVAVAEAVAESLRGEVEFLLWGRPSERALRRMAALPSPHRVLSMCSWTEAPRRLAEFDINLIPLADTPLNACKSSVHWLEAAALGIPSVASPVGEFPSVIHHGENGFLARERAEWLDCITRLVRSPDLRSAVGQRARGDLLATRTLRQQGPLLAGILEEILRSQID